MGSKIEGAAGGRRVALVAVLAAAIVCGLGVPAWASTAVVRTGVVHHHRVKHVKHHVKHVIHHAKHVKHHARHVRKAAHRAVRVVPTTTTVAPTTTSTTAPRAVHAAFARHSRSARGPQLRTVDTTPIAAKSKASHPISLKLAIVMVLVGAMALLALMLVGGDLGLARRVGARSPSRIRP